ncbi:MAG: heat-inducible transcriptional repressor HrcA, partial [Pseudomonadota bacterium]
MASPPITELTLRAREIFRLVVEDYLSNGQPVGSKTLAARADLNLSPASIRSVLSDLERAGLLAAPHTSAGRMPTETGLRLFVDGMMQVAEPTAQERAVIEAQLAIPGPIEHALTATSSILSDLSGAAGMVMVPQREARVAQLNIVPLDANRALVVLVGEDGNVENRLLDLPPGTSPAALQQASNYMNARLAGRTLREAVGTIEAEIRAGSTALDEASRDLVERGIVVWSEDAARRRVLIVRGQANLLDETALGHIERIRSLIDDLENKQTIAELLDSARE